jgi:alpha-galactosidase
MDSLRAAAGKDLFLSLSIAPLFPYQYGNSRRMCCDSWANIGNTQYVMNALSFGWWTNQLYRFNDPDHLVLQKEGAETLGENRARVTTGAISGMFLFGDNFSAAGPSVGFPEKSRERAMQFMTNRDINELAALGRSFRPVEGSRSTSDGAENLFVLETDRYVYLACLNYGRTSLAGSLPLERLGLTAGDVVQVRELWLQADGRLPDSTLDYEVPPADARVYRITKR